MTQTAMLIIGGDVKTLAVAKDAIIEVLKAAGTEAACVAAMTTLAALAKSPDHTQINNCNFTNNPARKAKRNSVKKGHR